ncbi:FtsQ-type POTRA domain-containing protein [Dactylosporangium aurantiacum]|uniref:FtsQ-type POTRA domain-containing protein n=1 Tax=Dactylosporangium aurantiacum TaxID=35754 RepID=A0A9Q9IF85_9ACTN|nr:FtsQ-type POTRA domain-containing protein [Dactylosporangium aurantiacum]MDG6102531.1 FtsQ-type POTRA domain-containing protein [Dactylosporangium aurantiacum]UWZ53195.1 FtsQ-type POTRA domain-containing protein [Dactylosporangium aurantiacum]
MTSTRGWRLVLAPRTAPAGSSQRRFARRARQHRLRVLLSWLVGLGVVALLGGVVAVVYATPALGVHGIRVTGVVALTAQEVRDAAGVARGTPLARLDLGVVERRVRQLKPVRTVTASKDYPRTLVLAVRERTAVAVVPRALGFVLLDTDGVAYLPVGSAPPGLPVLRLAAPGPGDPATEAALTVLAALPPWLRDPLVALAAEAPTRIRLELTERRTVVWGDATENEAKIRVLQFTKIAPDKTLDVSAPGVVLER